MKYKLVIFDLDNTLVLTRPAAKIGYKQAIYYIAKMNGLDKSRDKLYHHWKRIIQPLLIEKEPEKRRFTYSLQILLNKHGLPDTYLQPALNLYEKEMLNNLKLVKGAKELLSSLNEAHLKIAVTTGSERSEARKKLKSVGLVQYMDMLVSSSDVGSMKPSLKYYQLVLSEYKFSVKDALVIGDSRIEDIEPASKMGLTAFIVTPQTHLMEFRPKII